MFFDTSSLSSGPGATIGHDSESYRMRILLQASTDDLKRAQNHAYMSLFEAYLKLQGQITGKECAKSHLKFTFMITILTSETIATLKSLLLQKPPVQNSSALVSDEGPKPSSLAPPPSPPECGKEDYEDVKFWTIGEWNEYKSRYPDCGKLDFLTDDGGSKVSKDRLKEMSMEARVLFNELYRHRLDPTTWST